MGKTFIAAVVMYNYYRWFPAGKIIFTAPTRPLVRQQIEACHDVVGIPEREIAHLDGNIPADRRHGNRTHRTFDYRLIVRKVFFIVCESLIKKQYTNFLKNNTVVPESSHQNISQKSSNR